MISTKNIVESFSFLGDTLRSKMSENLSEDDQLAIAISQSIAENRWFTEEFVRKAINSLAENLNKKNLEKWLRPYSSNLNKNKPVKNIAVVMAGNLPLVGFHDFLSVICSGHNFIGKLSSDDKRLLPAIAKILISFQPELESKMKFTEDKLKDFDAVIATGSNNTSRYFDYYFGKYPNIIRKNRNGVAVLNGDESQKDLNGLAEDVFLYYGMGCRSVSKLYVPTGYDFNKLMANFSSFDTVIMNNKYKNNYDYYRSIFLINNVKHLDNGVVMVKEDLSFSSPPSVLHYEEYGDLNELQQILLASQDQIQCIVSKSEHIINSISFGKSQKPELWDYADGVDTMEFLTKLSH